MKRFIIATLILNDLHTTLLNIGINPTRSYILEILKEMGARIIIKNKRIKNNEEIDDIECFSSN